GLRYPVPEDVTALIADVSGTRIRPFADLGTSARLHELLERNRLGLVDAAGDNLLFLRDAPDSVSLWSQGERPVPAPRPVTFDAAPGTYMLGMRVGRRDQLDQVLCEPDDPQVRAQSNVVELGRFTVAAGARAYR